MENVTIKEYMGMVARSAQYPEELKLIYPTMGLPGEVGEVCNKVKKIYRDNGGEISEEKREAIIKELSDCMWYMGALSKDLGTDLQTLMNINYEKIEGRMLRGTIKGEGDNR